MGKVYACAVLLKGLALLGNLGELLKAVPGHSAVAEIKLFKPEQLAVEVFHCFVSERVPTDFELHNCRVIQNGVGDELEPLLSNFVVGQGDEQQALALLSDGANLWNVAIRHLTVIDIELLE